MIDKSDRTKWNPYTGRRMACEHLALAVLCGFGFWRKAEKLAVRWAGSDEMRWRP